MNKKHLIEQTIDEYKRDYAQTITDVGGFGLAKHIERFLTTAMQRVYEVVSEEKWEELNKYTIREKQENMTDWIDWDDVCKVFGKKTALEKRIKEKQEELDELLSTLNNKT